jgi:hypothetical protein
MTEDTPIGHTYKQIAQRYEREQISQRPLDGLTQKVALVALYYAVMHIIELIEGMMGEGSDGPFMWVSKDPSGE